MLYCREVIVVFLTASSITINLNTNLIWIGFELKLYVINEINIYSFIERCCCKISDISILVLHHFFQSRNKLHIQYASVEHALVFMQDSGYCKSNIRNSVCTSSNESRYDQFSYLVLLHYWHHALKWHQAGHSECKPLLFDVELLNNFWNECCNNPLGLKLSCHFLKF